VALSKRATDAVVGGFVVLGVLVVVAATMWARESRLGRGKATVTARFHDVGGAGVGTNLYVHGVRAGRVAALELGDDGWVRARIALDPAVRIPEDPVVVLGASGLVGDWQGTITTRDAAPDDPDVRRQLAEASGERGVLPGATLPDVKQFAAGAGRILDDVGVVAGRVRTTFDDSSARDLRATLANARAFSASLAATGVALHRTVSRLDAASADGGELQRGVRDAAATVADLRAAAAELRALTARDGETRAAVDRVIARVDTLVARTTAGTGTLGRVVGDPSLYDGADSLVTELRALVADIKARPKRYVNVRVF